MNSTQGIILYAKHWFVETDVVKDLQKILYIDHYDMSEQDVVEILINMSQKVVGLKDYLFREFIKDLHPSNTWKFNRPCESVDPFHFAVIAKTLSMLSLTDHKDIINIFEPLCRPDYSILLKPNRIRDETLDRIFGEIA